MHQNYINLCKIINTAITRQFTASVNFCEQERIFNETPQSKDISFLSVLKNEYIVCTKLEFLLDGWNWELSLNPSQLPASVTNELCQVFTFCVVLLSKIYKKQEDIHSLWGSCSQTFLIIILLLQ